jgi:glycosyltransferase involved in cell wall biosynthesis
VKILLLTRYDRLGASSRLRALQYLPYFQSLGWQVDPVPFFSQAYLRNLYAAQSTWKQVLIAYLRRFKALTRAGDYDLVWIEKEVLPFFPAVAERLLKGLRIPYMVDYDDALFHQYDLHRLWPVRAVLGRKIDAVMRHASVVVAGNQYLADRARNAGARSVEIVPTVIDLDRYATPVPRSETADRPLVVGWIGTPKTSRYLHPLKSVFASLQSRFNVRFVAVGASRKSLGGLPVEPWPWTEATEVESIKKFDIGIMPLDDSPWERGKCGYKLIQYMACGLPVVASPVGVNCEIVEPAVNGWLVDDLAEWENKLVAVIENSEMRQGMGRQGRARVEEWYSLQAQAERVKDFLREAVNL